MWVASDEIYHGLQFDEDEHTVLEYTDRSFVLNGFSKAYAMTGWRLGYLICPPDFVRACEKIQQNFFLCANAFVQAAGTVALTQAQGDVARMRAIYDERRAYLVPELQRIGLGVKTAARRGVLRVLRRPSLGRGVAAARVPAPRRGGGGGRPWQRLRPGRRGVHPRQLCRLA